MNNKEYEELLSILKNEVIAATGCTEPIAVAYSTAVAGNQICGEEIKMIEVCVDIGIFKNGLKVGIPGIKERGLDIAAALGVVVCKPEKKLRILENVSLEQLEQAKNIVKEGRVKISLKKNCDRLFIETIITTDKSVIRTLTLDRHQNIVKVEKNDKKEYSDIKNNNYTDSTKPIQKYNLDNFIEFSNTANLEDIDFLYDGVNLNLAIANEGLNLDNGIGREIRKMIIEGLIEDSMITRAQILCSAASEARMSGSKLPVMSSAGSGNHGITVFLTNVAVAQKTNVSDEKLIRALVLSNLLTVYIKSYTGTLSAMCGCGVAAGIGASAGVVYIMNGDKNVMYGALLNMVASISGLICDGGKEGCAYKLALSSGWAVESALLSVRGVVANKDDGILSPHFRRLFENLGLICRLGMSNTNEAIIDVICS